MTKEEAVNLYESNFYSNMTAREIAIFQLFEERLCIPFAVFHKAVEESLGRPVVDVEFVYNLDGLRQELLGVNYVI